MKGVALFLVIIMSLFFLTTCTDTIQQITPQTSNLTDSLSTELPVPSESSVISQIQQTDESCQNNNEVEEIIDYNGIDKVVLHWSGRFPPQSQEDDAANPEHYTAETVFLSDGRVEHTEKTYYGYVLHSTSWQIDSESFIALIGILKGKAFLALPDNFNYGAFDESAYTLTVYSGDTFYQCAYAASNGSNEDVQSYTVTTGHGRYRGKRKR
jgi:hypothetical protein